MMHRIRQGMRALMAWAHPVDVAAAEAVLSEAELALFKRMRRSEQLHSLVVLATLQAEGHTLPDLLVAGLLHDVGKSRAPIGLVGRTLAVLAKAFVPGRYQRWSEGDATRGWRRAFVVAEQHPEWGAALLAEAGGTETAATLVRRHQEQLGELTTEEERLLAVLQAADAAD